jgi:hypothetical protein
MRNIIALNLVTLALSLFGIYAIYKFAEMYGKNPTLPMVAWSVAMFPIGIVLAHWMMSEKKSRS